MKRDTADQGIVAHRRRRVAYHRLRGLAVREIATALEVEGLRNPDSEEPWTHATVHRDCVAMVAEWRRDALGDTAPLRAELWAELREVRRAAWEAGDTATVLRAVKQEAELLGLDAEKRVKIDIDERVRRLADILNLSYEEALAEVNEVLREHREIQRAG